MQADHEPEGRSEPKPSMLPFDPADLVALRVTRAEFARMCGVSRQAVSVWVREGKVTIGPDGKLDPARASKQLLRTSDPARMRARIFRDALQGRDELRERIKQLEAELADARDLVRGAEAAYRNRFMDAQACRIADLCDLLTGSLDELARARDEGRLDDRLDELVTDAFYPDTRCGPDADGAAATDPTADDNDPGPVSSDSGRDTFSPSQESTP